MITNLERFQKDLEKLLATGSQLELAMQYACHPDSFKKAFEKLGKKEAAEVIKVLPNFKKAYQRWYSEALVFLRQVLPDRVLDFMRHYEKPKVRKDITHENYRIEDYLQGLNVTRGYQKEKVVGPDSAIPQFQQQLAIVEAAQARFESSLFEIRHLVQADLLDSELEAADVLAGHKFVRAAGAVAGVVLERHLAQVLSDHQIVVGKRIREFQTSMKRLRQPELLMFLNGASTNIWLIFEISAITARSRSLRRNKLSI